MKNFCTITLGLFLSLNLHAALSQGFEDDVSGITSVHTVGEPTTPNLVRVASGGGFLGVSTSSQGGSFLAEVAMVYEDGQSLIAVQGDRIKWNDGPYSGGFASGHGYRVDVFFDDPSFYDHIGLGSTADGFFFQPTLLNDGNVGAVNGGGFGTRIVDPVGLDNPSDFVWRVGADGDAKGFSGVSSFIDIDVASSGWYTMSTIWETNPSGNINQVNTLTDIASGSVVYTKTIEDAVLGGQAGALGTASIGNGDLDSGGGQVGPASSFGDLAIDNVFVVVPESSTYALIFFALGLSLAVFHRRR